MNEYKIIRLEAALLDEVADLYARVWAGPPWFEIKKCASCNETYGKGDDLQIFHDGDTCRRCGQPLKLIDYWYGGPAHQVFEDAVSRRGFVGVGARRISGELIAFSWGFAVPDEDTPTVWFGQVTQLLRDQGIGPHLTFYAAETGVDPRHHRKGIGSKLVYLRFQAAREMGFQGVCNRTANPNMMKIYQRFFGEEYVLAIFTDPDPVRSDRPWYYCPLDKLRHLPDLLDAV